MKKSHLIHSNHFYHIVSVSPWPIIQSFNTIIILLGLIIWFNEKNIYLFLIGLTLSTFSSFQWWRDIIRESSIQGIHTFEVYNGLRLGIILFIISELFFFISFFWTYFHIFLSPSIEIGRIWPPKGISPFNPYAIPLLNSIILIRSGISITWSHNRILKNNWSQSNFRLKITIILGIYFTLLQLFEYKSSTFSISDRNYGSIFFLATGFHGIHVIIGTSFLITCLLFLNKNIYSPIRHFRFEAACWYWHFVDVVWLFLYINIYWWNWI